MRDLLKEKKKLENDFIYLFYLGETIRQLGRWAGTQDELHLPHRDVCTRSVSTASPQVDVFVLWSAL